MIPESFVGAGLRLDGGHRERLHHPRRDAALEGHRAGGGLTLLLGIDRFMSEAQAFTNLIGNAVATIVVSKWENDFAFERAKAVLSSPPPPKSQ